VEKNAKTIAVVACVGIVAFVAYKKLHKSYDPIEFLDKTYLHVEEVSQGDHVESHFYTPDGKPVTEAREWLQVTDLGPKVTLAMRDTVDRQIRNTMRAKPHEGDENRLFGVFQTVAFHVYMMESTYVIYAAYMVDGDRAAYEAKAASTFEKMEWLAANGL
jgi:hypothetical protein